MKLPAMLLFHFATAGAASSCGFSFSSRLSSPSSAFVAIPMPRTPSGAAASSVPIGCGIGLAGRRRRRWILSVGERMPFQRRRRHLWRLCAADSGDDSDNDGNGGNASEEAAALAGGNDEGDEDHGDELVMSEVASEDLFDDLDLDELDELELDLDLDYEGLEELFLGDDDAGDVDLSLEDIDDDLLMFMNEEDKEDSGDEPFVVASADLEDDELLELLQTEEDADPDDLQELEQLLDQRRKIEDALELRRILGEERLPTRREAIDEKGDEKDAAFNATSTTPDATSKDSAPASFASSQSSSTNELERALLQGVVPADAGVGSGSLPGDYGFDPLDLASEDYFKRTQNFLLGLLPDPDREREEEMEEQKKREETVPRADMEYDGSALPKGWRLEDQEQRPPALILRDYREAEIRHGRLAMLAAVFWPLQEILDRLLIPSSFGKFTVIYGGPTLPFFSLLMIAVMLLLGYLDIYAAAVKDADAGEAFLPGECFWDPLRILDGARDGDKRRMQERELNNGRTAMIAVAFYILEESITHQPLISLPFNEVLFEPAYQIPAVRAWLDRRFQSPSPAFTFPEVGTVDFVETLREVLEEEGSTTTEGGAAGGQQAAQATSAAMGDLWNGGGLEGAVDDGGGAAADLLFPDTLRQL